MTNNKILYNVTVKISNEKHDEWLHWMKETHIPDVMATNKFENYQISKILDNDPDDATTYAIQYIAMNMATFQDYQQEHAKALQQDHTKRYEGHYVAFRTLMEIVHPV